MSAISLLADKGVNKIDEMDKEIDSAMKLAEHVGDWLTRNKLKHKLLNMKLKIEKLRHVIFLSRSQSNIAEIEQQLARNDLDKEMCEFRSLFKKLRSTDEESREAKKAKLSKERENSDAERCPNCKSRLTNKISKSKKKSKVHRSKDPKDKLDKHGQPKTKHASQTNCKHNDKCKHNTGMEKNNKIILSSQRITFEEPSITSPNHENNKEKNTEDKNGEGVIVIEQHNATNRLFEEILNSRNDQPIQIDLESMSAETVKIHCSCESSNCFEYQVISP